MSEQRVKTKRELQDEVAFLRHELVELRALCEQANVKAAAPKHGVKIRLQMPNGELVVAHTEQWIVSMLLVGLPETDRDRVIDNIRRQTIAWSTPGSFVLRTEGMPGLVRAT